MKKLLTLSLLLLSASATQAADVKYVNADGSPLSATCISALQGAALSHEDKRTLLCNGMPVQDFLSKHSEPEVRITGSQKIVFRRADDSMETELCYAAITTGQSIEQLTQRFAVDDLEKPEEEIMCNRMPLKSFVRKYGSRALTAAL